MKGMSLAFVTGALASAIFVGGIAWLYHSKTLEKYALAQLKEAEYASAEALVGMGPAENGQVQSNYLSYVHSAWEHGGLSDREYRRGLAIGLLRWCMTLRQRDKVDVAEKACAMSEYEFARWNPVGVSYEEFREQAISEDPRENELRYE